MANRWFHAPVLRSPSSGERRQISWLELFFDLLFAAAILHLGAALEAAPSGENFFRFVGLAVPLWAIWTGFAFYCNHFSVDDFAHRLLVFGQGFAVGAMTLSAPELIAGQPRWFAAATGIGMACAALQYGRAYRHTPEARGYARHWSRAYGLGAALWGLSALVPAPSCYAVWALGLLGIVLAPLSKHVRERVTQWDRAHVTERFGVLIAVTLGASFIDVLRVLDSGGADVVLAVRGGFILLVTCCIWWMYFDDVAGARIRGQRITPLLWLYAHLPLLLGVVATGMGLRASVHLDLAQPAPEPARWLLLGSLALVLLSVGGIDALTERRQAELSDRARVNMRVFSAALVLLLAPAGASMSAAWLLGLAAFAMIGQVAFDMMVVPTLDGPASAAAVSVGHLAREAAARADAAASERANSSEERARSSERDGDYFGRDPAGDPRQRQQRRWARPRVRIGEVERTGAPSELRSDLYFYFMNGTWTRLLLAFAFLYVMGNVFFAALFMLEPGCIDSVRPGSFGDAFFFSVQTLSTIGYGVMSPATTYGHVVVVVEAATGLLGVAMATGLLFAKASRPQSGILFSDALVLSRRDGRPELSFRVGNARGNDIVDATIMVTVIKDELSSEGRHLRRLHDVELVRSRSPLFVLSWSVMHTIDDRSPFYDIDWRQPEDGLIGVIVTLLGHDSTYGQTVYTRKIYEPGDILPGRRFADVVSQYPDGRMRIDYGRFHDTEPDGLREPWERSLAQVEAARADGGRG
ncbi:low temperature requirement protein A [Haliangium ochraceum]|uniref:K channel inward rectifier conserved region 2 domain protein n=1 Tax=Haliangium ochraceum (strain DSM 14365 / JCM 11303 / SMP-2) TaxID=502025 RepID=D0LV78_HALO1|nr:low temperature requirement protein A [Haliangium ochraceum]ACY15919.1 K channel inward rectifier conserved region 2 domain protein [Haliangium ochraceum DSM 14365]